MEPKRWLYWNGTGQINYRECQLIIRKQPRKKKSHLLYPKEGSFHLWCKCIHWLITPALACAVWTIAASKCYNPANMDALVPHRCRDTVASSPKCPHPSEAPQNNYLQQDPITRQYIKALKATFDRMLHLLKEQSAAPSSDQFLKTAFFFSRNRRIVFLKRVICIK